MVSLNSILAGIFVSSVPSLASESQDLSEKCSNFELLEMQNLMRPGQVTPNELEAAILERMAAENPLHRAEIGRLHVLSRTLRE